MQTVRITDPAATRRQIQLQLGRYADQYAAAHPGAQAWLGAGLSMEPLLPADAWIITEPLPYLDLQVGQVVLFTAPSGRLVAHALAKRTRQGWVTVGVNNDRVADSSLLNAVNYIGVVTTALIARR